MSTEIPIRPLFTRDFRRIGDGRYLLEVPQLADLRLVIDRLRRERGLLHGEASVAWADGILFAGNVNASSMRDRKELASTLAARSHERQVDWLELVSELCEKTITAEREGSPGVILRDLPRPEPDDGMVVDGIHLLGRHPVILFGDGGEAKSYLALYLAGRLEQMGHHVLYADWEFAGEDHRERLERLFGSDMPGVDYIRCERPLVAEVDRLSYEIAEFNVDYLIIDSVAFAADGPPEAAEVAGDYFRALRRLHVGSLNVAHTTKADGADAKPFGSTFWHNGARSTWYIKRSAGEPGDAQLSVALFNRKANLGPLRPATGYRIEFGADRTTFTRQAVADMASDLADRLPLSVRMAALVAKGAMTAVEIASELEAPVDSVAKTARRGDGKRFARVPGADGIYRIGLAARVS